ncbi:MAG: hypothetical protein K5923_03140 [Clostridia bacterium]|nr:hypothetical protein [Clostridia bacterium]
MRYRRACKGCGSFVTYSDADEYVICPECGRKVWNTHFYEIELPEDELQDIYTHKQPKVVNNKVSMSQTLFNKIKSNKPLFVSLIVTISIILILSIVLPVCLTNCEKKKEEVTINSSNYRDYITITINAKNLQREDGTLIYSTDRSLYKDSIIPFSVLVEGKDGVDIKRINLSIKVGFNITYYKFDSSLGGNRMYHATMSKDCGDMVFNDMVNSYSFVFKYEKMSHYDKNGIHIDSISGKVMA